MQKALLTISTLTLAVLSLNLFAKPPVIYGEDNRVDTIESTSALYRRLARSTAAQVEKGSLKRKGSRVELHGGILADFVQTKYRRPLCADERFYHQVAASECSGFLVAPDVLVTAGHCMVASRCQDMDWVFDYKIRKSGDTQVDVAAGNVYGCKEIIDYHDPDTMGRHKDFAVVRLDRPVRGVTPLKVSRTPVRVGQDLVMIGHPSGIPQKIADGGKVRSLEAHGFRGTVDAFGGNSGSAVFDAKSGEIVGILVNGAEDYALDRQQACMRVNYLSENSPGEGISGVGQFLPHLPAR
jgi:V8-like Glu-specific endopeptidase